MLFSLSWSCLMRLTVTGLGGYGSDSDEDEEEDDDRGRGRRGGRDEDEDSSCDSDDMKPEQLRKRGEKKLHTFKTRMAGKQFVSKLII